MKDIANLLLFIVIAAGCAVFSPRTKPTAVSTPISSTEPAAPAPDDGKGAFSQPLDSDDLAYLDNKPLFDPHVFVPSVDYAYLCDTCGQAESDKIHVKKPVPKSTQAAKRTNFYPHYFQPSASNSAICKGCGLPANARQGGPYDVVHLTPARRRLFGGRR